MKTNLPPKLDLKIRDLMIELVKHRPETVSPSAPSVYKTLLRSLLEVLGYKMLPNGSLVSQDVKVTHTFGTEPDYSKYDDEFERDYEEVKAIVEADNEDSNSESSLDTGPGESS